MNGIVKNIILCFLALGVNVFFFGGSSAIAQAIIPGIIQAEDYNTGGEGVGYHDLTVGNTGGQYRSDDVDIEVTTDAGGGFDVGWAPPGEWLQYNLTVVTGGTYVPEVRAARGPPTPGALHLEVDGVNVTGTIVVPSTGGFQSWTTVSSPGIVLTAGIHQVRLVFEIGFNLNWLRFTAAGGAGLTISPPAVAVAVGGQQTFTGAGGVAPYAFILTNDTTGGASINFLTGLYTAGPNPGTSTIRMADSSVPEQAAQAVVTVNAALTISPPAVTVAANGQQTFTGVGGVAPYSYAVVADTTGGASVNATTGVYTAGPNAGTSTVRVWDTSLATANAGVTVTGVAALTISPAAVAVAVGGQQTFTGAGGVAPYSYSLQGDTTGGATLNVTTGAYTAGPTAGTSTVRVTDSAAATAQAVVTVNAGGGVAITLQAEDYNNGGEGVGYHDLTVGNTGGQYRSDDVDIEVTTDAGGGFDVGWAPPGEWLQYNLTVVTGGTYVPEVRAARGPPTPGALHLEVDGVNVTGTIVVPSTGGFQSWTTVSSPGIVLTAGIHQVRLVFEIGFNLNWLRFTAAGGAGLTISPPAVAVAVGGQQTFTGAGGVAPYSYSLQGDTTGGATLNVTTGAYTAGPNAGKSTVRVTDANSNTANAGITVTTGAALLYQGTWSLHSVSSEVSSARGGLKAFDGNPNTNWTPSQDPSSSPPHDLQINLGNVFEIEGFKMLPLTPSNGVMTSFYEFFVSVDGVTWGEPVASGEFIQDFTEKEVLFPRIAGQYVRIRPLGEHNNRNFIILSELNVWGASFSGNYPPNGIIESPNSNLTINAGNSVSFSGTFSDSNGDSALSYVWDFDDPTIPDSLVEDPGLILFNNPGTYKVRFTVTDEFGLTDPFPGSVTVKVLAGASTVLSRDSWTIKYVNSEEVILAAKAAENVLDGNPNTFWQTQFFDVGRPHDIQINLGSAYAIDAFRYLPPQGQVDGRIEEFHIYISPNGVNWGPPVATGKFVNSASEQRVVFPPKIGQFVRLVAITEVNGNQWAAMAEVNLEGKCSFPYVRIIDPTNGVEARPDLVVSASVCLTQASHAGWGVKFSVDGGSQQQTILLPTDGVIYPNTFQATFTGMVGDNHQVEAFIVDNIGNEVSGNNTYDKITHVGLGDTYVAIGDSTTVGVADDDDTDAISQDGRNTNTGRGPTPRLNDLLTAERGYPHNIINEGYSGGTSAEAILRVPGILRERNQDTKFLIALGINDANSGLVPSGKGLNPGNPGYPGTFKANLQQIINLIYTPSLNRAAYLAKVAYSTNTANHADLQDYNIAIGELVTENGVSVVPPDLFAHFQANQQELAGDGLHPTGAGYKSIASLWCIAITNGTCSIP